MRSAAIPTTTLLVSTYEWPEALDLVLRSALAQRTLPGEVVVADDGSGPATAAVLDGHRARFAARGVPLVHAWHEDRGFRKARILNAALARARGEYVLQIDGDLVLHPAFVESHVRFARAGTFVQGSRVLLGPARTRAALARGDTRVSVLDRDVRNRANAVHAPWLARLVPTTTQDPLKGIRGVNFAFWRADAERVNGWNEAFVGWGREDSEFAARLLHAGVRRRKLKFAGVGYHLWHPESPRAMLDENQRLYEEIVRTGASRCAQGLDGHRGAAPADG